MKYFTKEWYKSGEFKHFCFMRLKPLVELWSKKTGVIADYEFETQGGKNISEQLISDDNFYIPTDGIIISDCIILCTQKNMFLNKKTYIPKEIKSLCKADKQFIKLPYISDDDIMKLFFETNRFNDDEKDLKNHKLLNKYSAFSRQYLSNILTKWCRKNQISYICYK